MKFSAAYKPIYIYIYDEDKRLNYSNEEFSQDWRQAINTNKKLT